MSQEWVALYSGREIKFPSFQWKFQGHLFIHLFDKHALRTDRVPGVVLGTGDKIVIKKGKVLAFAEFTCTVLEVQK